MTADQSETGQGQRVLDMATGLLHWSSVKDFMLWFGGHDQGYEPLLIESAFVRCPFCDHILPPGTVIGSGHPGSTPGGAT